jgi:hypothetical protein
VTIIDVSQVIRQFEMTQQMMERVRSSAWPTKMAAVLGLVTNDPLHRDPSYVSPLMNRELWRRAQIVVVALCALLLLYLVFWRG